MRIHILTAIFLFCTIASVASAQTTPAVGVELDRCIRDNAIAVERAMDDLDDATTFLTQQVCAVESTAEFARRQQEQMTTMRARFDQACAERRAAGQTQTPTNSEEGYDPCAVAGAYDSVSSNVYLDYVGLNRSSAAATALAARLLLERRLARRQN